MVLSRLIFDSTVKRIITTYKHEFNLNELDNGLVGCIYHIFVSGTSDEPGSRDVPAQAKKKATNDPKRMYVCCVCINK